MSEPYLLLVEDDPDDEALALRALRRAGVGFEIRIVHDGVAALERLLGEGGHEIWPLPRVVLLDLKLPRVDGLEVLRRLREDSRTRTLPVVILTSSDEVRDLSESYRCGCNSYVRKPVEFEGFVEVVRSIGEYWVHVNRTPPTGD